ncbi:hypothetical protein KCH_30510 [Kitasatospora cheerisanensis KCTC 2395]|uniref:Uncharacterized protein n=1 Tax=Kitasatospora cheerisanensis KCTC 2395 TaxID=1348663 RepID=A0A066YVK3_9ACTN|nr:hypothetical protein KCH_30510 [Kitasatospora cheerisanensis KCTC 2395]
MKFPAVPRLRGAAWARRPAPGSKEAHRPDHREGPDDRAAHPDARPPHPSAGPPGALRPTPRPAPAPGRGGRADRPQPRAACEGGRPARPHSVAPSRTGHSDLATRFARRLVEVLCGVRPVHQLQRHTTLPGFHQLASLTRSGPLRPRGRSWQPRLGHVHDSAPVPGAVEACVRVQLGPRHHMLAFRLEQHTRTGQWQCAAIEAR